MVDLLRLRSAFAKLEQGEPRFFSAPGRVNLIGEHTDYNDGFVLPMGANLRTYVACGPRRDGEFWVQSLDLDETASFSLHDVNENSSTPSGDWIRYIHGIVSALTNAGLKPDGASLIIASDIPIGAGLSSSAALEIAVGYALAEIAELEISRLELAVAGQKAEHLFVGTKSGLMDQLTATFAERDHAMLIDCRSVQIKQIPMNLPDAAVVICDTRVKHALVSSAYNERRRECEEAVELLRKIRPDVRALRDIETDDLGLVEELPEIQCRRARHVITENARTLDAARALKANDADELGRLMVKSHISLRNDFEVSCHELDVMFGLAMDQDGVFGARMMGGGFGGCTINLVARQKLASFSEQLTVSYQAATGLLPRISVVEADEGVGELFV